MNQWYRADSRFIALAHARQEPGMTTAKSSATTRDSPLARTTHLAYFGQSAYENHALENMACVVRVAGSVRNAGAHAESGRGQCVGAGCSGECRWSATHRAQPRNSHGARARERCE